MERNCLEEKIRNEDVDEHFPDSGFVEGLLCPDILLHFLLEVAVLRKFHDETQLILIDECILSICLGRGFYFECNDIGVLE